LTKQCKISKRVHGPTHLLLGKLLTQQQVRTLGFVLLELLLFLLLQLAAALAVEDLAPLTAVRLIFQIHQLFKAAVA
jgi:hypothetical protein